MEPGMDKAGDGEMGDPGRDGWSLGWIELGMEGWGTWAGMDG